jgi:hypothetical protein
MLADFTGRSVGFRVDDVTRTVRIIKKTEGDWFVLGEPRRYPLSPDILPDGPSSSACGAWELAWLLLKEDNDAEAEKLKRLVTAGH